MASAFNIQGATPSLNAVPGQSFNVLPQSTPAANALNYAQITKPPVAPTNQPIKSHKVGPDGTVTQTYDTSATPTNSSPNQTVAPGANTPGYTYVDGKLTSVGGQPIGTGPGMLSGSPAPQNQSVTQTDGSQSLGVNGVTASPMPGANTGGTTPNGTQVDAQGNVISPSPSTPSSSQTAISGLLNNASTVGSEVNSTAAGIASLKDQLARASNVYSTSGFLLPVAQGREQALAQTEASEESAAQSQLQNEIAGAGAQTTALNSAGTLGLPSNQNVQVPYNNQYLNATTGQPVGGGAAGTLPQAAQDAVALQVQKVKAGLSTVEDAQSALSAYGQAGINALQQGLGTDFSTNASNASAGTTATGQQLQTQATAANQALDTLSQQFSKLSSLTGATGFQPANAIEQSIAGLFGNDAVSQYQTTLQEARAKISGVLASSGGVTPTTADEMAKTYLPDGMTPSQLPAKISAAKTLIQQSVDAFTKSGQQNSSSGFTEGQTSSDGSLIYQNGQWVVKS